jgi:glucokinase
MSRRLWETWERERPHHENALANLLIFLTMPDFSIGVDLGGTNLRIAAITTEGELLEKITVPAKVPLGPDHVIGEMCNAILKLSEKHKDSWRFLGAGVGVPGVIDMQTGTMRKAANLPGFENYPVRAEIERRSGMLVVLENDARVATLGEQWLGAARGIANVAMITLGTGIGGGLVLEGKIRHGVNGLAGEFGHVSLEPDGLACGCGNRGCAEKYASASAILRMAREATANRDAPSLSKAVSSEPEFVAKAIYDLAMQGDEPARGIFVTFGRYLGILLVNLINVIDPEMFVIGGGVSSAWDAFAPKMFEELRTRSLICTMSESATMPATDVSANDRVGKTIITRALLGSDAGLYGAARAAALAR